ncbi:MAG: class I SAM-dependent methyltransferase [Opitutales bacterium]
MKRVDHKVYRNKGNPEVLRRVPDSAKRILDIGCGAGDNAAQLKERGAVVDGLTLSEEEAAVSREFCKQVVIHDLEQGLPKDLNGPYDAAICSHVLEHICWPEQLLEGVRKSLAPDGRLIVALPNMLNARNRIKIMLGQWNYTDSGLMDNTHFRVYTFKTAQEMLRKNGFEIIEAAASGFLPIPGWNRLPVALRGGIDRLSIRMLPGLFGHQLLYVAKPIPGG